MYHDVFSVHIVHGHWESGTMNELKTRNLCFHGPQILPSTHLYIYIYIYIGFLVET